MSAGARACGLGTGGEHSVRERPSRLASGAEVRARLGRSALSRGGSWPWRAVAVATVLAGTSWRAS